MDPNAPVPQGDNTNLIPPPLEETPSFVPPPASEPQAPEAVQTPPEPIMPTTPSFGQPPPAEVPQTPTAEPVMPPSPVDQPPPPAPVAPVPPEVSGSKSSPIFAIALTVLLIAIIGLGGYFLYTKYLGGSANKQATNETATIAPVVPIATPDPTADWKTYTNTKMGIEFKYPNTWSLLNDSHVSSAPSFDTGVKSQTKKGDGDENLINYTFEFQKDSLENYKTWKLYDTTKNLGLENISGISFEKYILADMYYSLDYIYEASDNGIYRFTVFPYEQNNMPTKLTETVNMVLSTFSFVEATPSSSPTSSPSATKL